MDVNAANHQIETRDSKLSNKYFIITMLHYSYIYKHLLLELTYFLQFFHQEYMNGHGIKSCQLHQFSY